jgi:hypothetical protein
MLIQHTGMKIQPSPMGFVANFISRRSDSYRWTPLFSKCRELLEWGLTRGIELPIADHVRDFDAFQSCRG